MLTMTRQPRVFWIIILMLLPALGGLACNAASTALDGGGDSVDQAAVVRAAVATIQAQDAGTVRTATQPDVVLDSELQDILTALYERVNPSVVLVVNSGDPFELGSGSGFVFDIEGHIVTNNHVVVDGESFEVVYADGERRRATIAGTDVDSDLAVLAVTDPPAGAGPLPLGDPEQIAVGQMVVALGSPFGEQGSMSFGIISGLGRTLESQRQTSFGGTYSLPQVIQTDAPINPGNSGGPLLNLNGEVVGVSSAIRTFTGINSGVGFAVPVAAVDRIAPSLITDGSYAYPYMGISASGTQISLGQQEAWGLPQASGVYIGSVTPESPADVAGLIGAGPNNLGGDLIVAVDGQPVGQFNDLISYLVFRTTVGQTIALTVIRDGDTLEIPLTLGERPQ